MVKKIAIITINKPSLESAKRLVKYLEEFEVDIYSKEEFNTFNKLDDILEKVWRGYDAVIAILAIGAVVRKFAPFLKDKSKDPGVVVINLELNRVIPLLGGHLGGANFLAELLCDRIDGCINFVTTATDQTKTLAFEMFAKKRGWRIENLKALANISNRLLNGKKVKVATYSSIFESIEDKRNLELVGFDKIDSDTVVIAYKKSKSLTLLPQVYIGIGCNRGTRKDSIKKAFFEFLAYHDIKLEDVGGLASFEAKSDEVGLLEFASEMKLNIKFFKKDDINSLEKDFSDSASTKFFGLKGVAEPSSVLASEYKELVFKKISYFGEVTVAGSL